MEQDFKEMLEESIPNYDKVLPPINVWKLKNIFNAMLNSSKEDDREKMELYWKNEIAGLRRWLCLDYYPEFTNEKIKVLNRAKNN